MTENLKKEIKRVTTNAIISEIKKFKRKISIVENALHVYPKKDLDSRERCEQEITDLEWEIYYLECALKEVEK